MSMGVFSLSLNVKDVAASAEFYKKLGFREIGGKIEDNWLILTNGDANLGLFKGMIEKNTLTFNPGWGAEGKEVDEFEDIRAIQARLKAEGIPLDTEADAANTGPAHFILTDPDGNPILVDQHR